ncbi:MAG: 50S ribosomal protein L6 [Desulfurococcales archaeon]|nr:50S ribosomal protein L6 [Desulfurococcales archaeon]MEB3772971.1 50S ribosomal protein L6 [Desulfurococcales archaeon]MEB3786479.1 50S ribosomal protein L6 [Desulfurococcales archaeon]MEB3798801.1 50S ribosomal protein L6 [Desulfurococcales archaeon]MEB3846123.1 50S ribosomal protein L6 [Desulfurococcales archaeon]
MARDVHVRREAPIPEGVNVSIDGLKVTVEGPKGRLERDFSHMKPLLLRVEDNKVVAEAYFAKAKDRAKVGTVIAHIKNMFIGVTKGYKYYLKIIFSHFPITVKVEGDKVLINNFLGERSPRVARIMPGVKVSVKGEDVIVEGIDVEAVGQTAANIELATKIKGFDRRKFMDGVYIYKKKVVEE